MKTSDFSTQGIKENELKLLVSWVLEQRDWKVLACMSIPLQIKHDFQEFSHACLIFILIMGNLQVSSCFVVFDYVLRSSRSRKSMHVVFMNILKV